MSVKTCEHSCRTCASRCHRQYGEYPSREEALGMLFNEPAPQLSTELLPLEEALDRVVAQTAVSARDVPNADTAMHDGFAIRQETLAKSGGKSVLYGDEFVRLGMGDLLPKHFDTLVPSELCRPTPDNSLRVLALPQPGEGVVIKGSKIKKGERVVSAGQQLNPYHLCMLRYCGIEQVPVFRKPKVYILPVGDDLSVPGRTPAPGMSTESDGILLYAMSKQHGAEPFIGAIVPDDQEKIIDAIYSALPRCDLLLIVGGFGREAEKFNDHSANAVKKIGKILTHGMRVGAGKASLIGVIDGKYVLGIPGPPHAAASVAEAFLPAILDFLLKCRRHNASRFLDVILGEDFTLRNNVDWTPPVHLRKEGNELVATLVTHMGDTVEHFVDASAWLHLKASDGPFKKGDRVQAHALADLGSEL